MTPKFDEDDLELCASIDSIGFWVDKSKSKNRTTKYRAELKKAKACIERLEQAFNVGVVILHDRGGFTVVTEEEVI